MFAWPHVLGTYLPVQLQPSGTRVYFYHSELDQEDWLNKATLVPGIVSCAICSRKIRERHFFNLQGDKRNLERVVGGVQVAKKWELQS